MIRTLIAIISILFLISCGQKQNKEQNDLLTYFEDFPNDTVKIEVEPYISDRGFEPSECLPLEFLPLFENMILQTQSESTGAKPVGKIQITDTNFLLVVVQQDNYGPVYHGLTYNSQKNKIRKSEKIAEVWGDAGDSEETYSIISLENEKIIIQKFIETCYDEFEDNEEEIIVTHSECSDSTATVEIKVE